MNVSKWCSVKEMLGCPVTGSGELSAMVTYSQVCVVSRYLFVQFTDIDQCMIAKPVLVQGYACNDGSAKETFESFNLYYFRIFKKLSA